MGTPRVRDVLRRFLVASGRGLLRGALAASFIWTVQCKNELSGTTDSGVTGVGGSAFNEDAAVRGSGGTPATGGSVSTGSTSPTGGSVSTGGTSASGGSVSTSHASPTDGSAGMGGASASDAAAATGGTRLDGGIEGGAGGASVGTGDSANGGVAGSGCADPLAATSCGNGTIEPGEQCDGANLRGLTCQDVDPIFIGGTLGCQPVVCQWDTTRCLTTETCGNGVLDPGEDCEPTLFYAEALHFCSDYLPGSDGALVECSASTCKYHFMNCAGASPPVCGNGIVESGEQCDGMDRLFRTCTEAYTGFSGGTLGCNQDTCEFDYTQCERCDGTRCGDGIVQSDQGEECDTTPTMTCADANRLFGTVSCTGLCRNDTSQCTGGCTYTPYGWICS